MHKIAVIIYGAPGSGKSTQAELVARTYGLVLFDTGRYIESVIRDPKNRRDPVITRQRKLYDSGQLCERPWVFKIVSRQIKRIIKAGYGLVLSGSPRSEYEAFDLPGRPGIYSILKKSYRPKNIFTFFLNVDPKKSIFRNSKRQMCSVCNRQYLFQKGHVLTACPFCAAPLRTRRDDSVETIKARLAEFEKRTKPIIAGLRRRGYTVRSVNGTFPPFRVFQSLRRWLP